MHACTSIGKASCLKAKSLPRACSITESQNKLHLTVSLMGLEVLKRPEAPRDRTLLETEACRACCTAESASSSTWYWPLPDEGWMSTLKGVQTLMLLKACRLLVSTAACEVPAMMAAAMSRNVASLCILP